MADQSPTEPIELPAATPGHCGLVAVVGRANVGKSMLVNTLLGEKISIVSPIAQTTRNTIRGVRTEARGQLVFLDTPGVHRAAGDLGRIMNRRARASIEGVDAILLVLDGSVPPREEDEGWMRRLHRQTVPCFAVINKTDLGAPQATALREMWDRAAAGNPPAVPARWFSLSAQTGEGTETLLAELFQAMPEGPRLFPDDVLTDFPRKLAVADFIREKLVRDLKQELPHSVAVHVESIEEVENHWEVQATVYVEKYSQKGIVIGEKGRRLRATRRASEKELAATYERDVTVHLWVKVEKNWQRNFWFLKKLGYV